MTPVVIAYGSNLGDSLGRIAEARLDLVAKVEIVADSATFISAPMYVEDQEDYYNGVWLGKTSLGPLALVEFLKLVEVRLGRTQGKRNGPRIIDLDLITYGSLLLRSESARSINLPHPRVQERRFVLEPWHSIDPKAVLPGVGLIDHLLKTVQDQRLERVAQTSLRQ